MKKTFHSRLFVLLYVALGVVLIIAYALNEEAKERAASYAKSVVSENDRYKALDADCEKHRLEHISKVPRL